MNTKPKPTLFRGDRVLWIDKFYTVTSTHWDVDSQEYEYGLANVLNRVYARQVKKEETP